MTAEPLPPYDDTVAPTFADFFAAHYSRVLRLAGRTFGPGDAEEIAQETMARAFECYDRLDRVGDLWPWVAVVARNVGHDLVWSRARLVPVDDVADETLPVASEPEPESVAVARDQARVLAAALARLSEPDVLVLRLREFEGLSFADVGARMTLTENAARQLHHRARQHLSRQFRRLGGGLPVVVPLLPVLSGGLRRAVAALRPTRTSRRWATLSVPVAIAIVGALYTSPVQPGGSGEAATGQPGRALLTGPMEVPVAAVTSQAGPVATVVRPVARPVDHRRPDPGVRPPRRGPIDTPGGEQDINGPGVMSNMVDEKFTIAHLVETDEPTHPLPDVLPRV